jgi:hypothetical protein
MAQSGAQSTVAAAFAAQDDRDVATLVRLIHPAAMAAFKQRQWDHAVMLDEMRSGIGYLSDSTSPEARAMGAEARMPQRTMLQGVFKVRDRAEFERLTPEQVVTRWFLLTTKRPKLPTGFPTQQRRREIIGELPDTDGLVHVLFRESWTPDSLPRILGRQDSQVRVVTAQETTAVWRVMLNGGLVYDESGGWSIGWNDDDETVVEDR